jgi:hypothetical protein
VEQTISKTEMQELRNMIDGISSGPQAFDDKVTVAKGLGVFGHAAPATQPAAIATVAGGTTVDAESRTAINAVLVALRNAGIIAT